MEIHPTPDQEAFIRAAIAAGRFDTAEDAVKEALALWAERERTLVELRATFDEAEASARRGEGLEITDATMRQLVDDVTERARARLAAEQSTGC